MWTCEFSASCTLRERCTDLNLQFAACSLQFAIFWICVELPHDVCSVRRWTANCSMAFDLSRTLLLNWPSWAEPSADPQLPCLLPLPLPWPWASRSVSLRCRYPVPIPHSDPDSHTDSDFDSDSDWLQPKKRRMAEKTNNAAENWRRDGVERGRKRLLCCALLPAVHLYL